MKRNSFIQELRGLSIIFICLYHYLKTKKTSGYLSVSIFLQISGYIITYSSLKYNLHILTFYCKRIVNIFPQLYIVITIILLVTRDVSYNNLKNMYGEIQSVIRMYCNYYFYKKEIDYFSQFDNPSYTLHFWYISLLEQIYVIYPLLYLIYIHYYKIFIIIVAIFFVAFSYYTFNDNAFAYYIILCRLYEYMLGMNCNSVIKLDKEIILHPNITIYIIISIQLIDIKVHNFYKFIVINISSFYSILLNNNSMFYCNALLDNIFLQLIGNLSYEIYLIHYPLSQLKSLGTLSYIFLTLLYAYILSFLKFLSKNSLFILSFLLPLLLDIYIQKCNLYYKLKYKNKIIADPANEYNIVLKNIKNYPIPKNRNSNIFLLLGDSHLQQWFPSIIRIAQKKEYGIVHKYFHIDIIEKNRHSEVEKFIKKYMQFKITFITSFFIWDSIKLKYRIFYSLFKLYINILLKYSSKVYIIEDIPFLSINPLDCVYSAYHLGKCYAILGINASVNKIPYIYSKNIVRCDMNKYICLNNLILLLRDGYIVYKDYHHLSLSYSITLTSHLSKCISL